MHIRRGDFKVTKGVTTLDRMPNEAVEMLDHHFSRDELLVILTDEANDPFFAEIMSAYKNHLFIDHHILEYPARDLDIVQWWRRGVTTGDGDHLDLADAAIADRVMQR